MLQLFFLISIFSLVKNKHMWMNHGVGIEYGSRSWLGGGGQRGKNWDNCNKINKNYLKSKIQYLLLFLLLWSFAYFDIFTQYWNPVSWPLAHTRHYHQTAASRDWLVGVLKRTPNSYGPNAGVAAKCGQQSQGVSVTFF